MNEVPSAVQIRQRGFDNRHSILAEHEAGKSLAQIARKYGLSRERIRQCVSRAKIEKESNAAGPVADYHAAREVKRQMERELEIACVCER